MSAVSRLVGGWLAVAAAVGAAGAEEIAFDPGRWPYTAIGKLNVVTGANRRQFCTATLLAPRLALTAAHCLWDDPRKRWVDPSSVHFVAGYGRGAWLGHSVASAIRRNLGFVYTDGTSRANLAGDWALLELAQALPIEPVELEPADRPPPVEDKPDVLRAGYRADKPHLMLAQDHCAAQLSREPAPLLVHDCRAVHGESGSALMRYEGPRPKIIGVLVAGPKEGRSGPSYAVPVGAFRETAVEMLKRP